MKLAKDLIKRCCYFVFNVRHQPSDKPNIILLTSRRGGSTLLTQIISASSPTLRVIDHAFGWTRADFLERRYLPDLPREQVIHWSDELAEYFDRLESGKLIVKTHWNPNDPDFVSCSDQLIYKITSAKALFDHFYNMDKFRIIFQVRHPISNALSMVNLGWLPTASAYLDDKGYTDQYLSEEQLNFCHSIMAGDDIVAQHVLSWCLENLAVFRSDHLSQIPIVSYEELVARPGPVIEVVASKLGLVINDQMKAIINKPSRSSKLSTSETHTKISDRQVDYLIGRWRKNISDSHEQTLMKILTVLGLDVYQVGDNMPTEQYQCTTSQL